MDTDKKVRQHKLFISHSSKDKAYVIEFVKLLESIGMDESNVVCTSVPGYGVPIGTGIYDWLREQFEESELMVIYFLSHNYYMSPASLNEMGAAWVVKSDERLILLPGFDFNNIKGCVKSDIAGFKLDGDVAELKEGLGELKDSLIRDYDLKEISSPRWERNRDEFIKNVNNIKEGTTDDKADKDADVNQTLIQNSRDSVEGLTYEDEVFLVFTTASPSAVVKCINALGGKSISGGSYNFTEDRSPRNIALWEKVVKDLENEGYIEDEGYKGELYKVTYKGHKASDRIKAEKNIDVNKGLRYYLYGEEEGAKLSFNLEYICVGDDPTLRNKTSDSDYILEVANTGSKAAMLADYIRFYIKDGKGPGKDYLVCDFMLVGKKDRVIQPNDMKQYVLPQQDYSALKYHCREVSDYKYDVYAPQIEGLPSLEGKINIEMLVGESIGRFSGVDFVEK